MPIKMQRLCNLEISPGTMTNPSFRVPELRVVLLHEELTQITLPIES
jgi:hypothetical protein